MSIDFSYHRSLLCSSLSKCLLTAIEYNCVVKEMSFLSTTDRDNIPLTTSQTMALNIVKQKKVFTNY